MQIHEERSGERFDLVVIHDAEDLIHPESLWWANYYAQDAAMVQIPVLPLATPALELIHGVYCDEFAAFQIKEMPARQYLGGFLPSCGVGTAFRRDALDRLAAQNQNRVFEPRCLTEDYEIGFRLRRLGCRTVFVPVRYAQGGVMATREYFPRDFRAAVRQRTRWMMGITLQSWELHGWRETLAHVYWFWRDRKGLLGSLVSPVINLFFVYSLICRWLGLAASTPPFWLIVTFWSTMALQAVEVSIKALCSARIYGWRFAAAIPLRIVAGNCVNFVAAVWAISRYAGARIRRRPLVWLKTDHLYPARAALMEHKRRLGEILAGSGYVGEWDLEAALASKPEGVRLGEYLIRLGKLTEAELYEALSLQHGLSMAPIAARPAATNTVRALPAAVARKWKVVPFGISGGRLLLAGPELLSDQTLVELRRYCSLEVQFHWITPAEFERIRGDVTRDQSVTPLLQ
jgi:adsorption protein B